MLYGHKNLNLACLPIPPRVLRLRSISKSHSRCQRGMSEKLSSCDSTVGQAKSGKEAVAQALTTHPDIVIMDLAMPKLDEAAARASSRPTSRSRSRPIPRSPNSRRGRRTTSPDKHPNIQTPKHPNPELPRAYGWAWASARTQDDGSLTLRARFVSRPLSMNGVRARARRPSGISSCAGRNSSDAT